MYRHKMVTEIAVEEQLVKRVVSSGNGGAVWVPRSWLGEDIVVIRPKKPKLSIAERILRVLVPYLQDVVGVFLYGSYARDEQDSDSDVDVLVVAKNKFTVKKHKKMDIKVVELDKLKETMEKNPIMYLSVIREAKAVVNSSLLDDLKKVKVDYKNFKWFIETAIDHVKSSKEFIELDKLYSEYLASYSVLYSIMLRLRGVFLIKCLIDKKEYSNKLFKKWILKNRISDFEYKVAYSIYRCVRDNKNIKVKIKISPVERLLNILVKEINSLKVKLYDK